MLDFVSGVRHREEELRRVFFSARFVRVLDSLGYAPRSPRRPEGLQQALFAYHEAWG